MLPPQVRKIIGVVDWATAKRAANFSRVDIKKGEQRSAPAAKVFGEASAHLPRSPDDDSVAAAQWVAHQIVSLVAQKILH